MDTTFVDSFVWKERSSTNIRNAATVKNIAIPMAMIESGFGGLSFGSSAVSWDNGRGRRWAG
jgi:type IV secretory pathway TrbL component